MVTWSEGQVKTQLSYIHCEQDYVEMLETQNESQLPRVVFVTKFVDLEKYCQIHYAERDHYQVVLLVVPQPQPIDLGSLLV